MRIETPVKKKVSMQMIKTSELPLKYNFTHNDQHGVIITMDVIKTYNVQ